MSNLTLFCFFKKNQKTKLSRIPLNYSRLVFGLAVCVMLWPTKSFSQTPCPSIHVKIQNINNSTGIIACAIFESKEGFPDKFMKMGYKVMTTQIEGKEASFEFSDLKPGTYAIVVIHDENLNGELDSNLFGIPTEGYGFSSGAEVKMSAPSFSEAQFMYTGGDLKLSIPINY